MTMTTTDGLPTVQVDVTQGGNPVIAKMVGFNIAANQRYAAQVDMRADIPANASASVEWDVKQETPWTEEHNTNVSVTNQWQTYTMTFQAGFGMTNIGRFGLSVENVPGNVYIRNWSLTQASVTGLNASESLEAGTVGLVAASEAVTVPRANDYLLFLTNRDQTYVQTIFAAVQGAIDTLVPVTGTQMAYGGLLDMDSQAGLADQDNHFYIDHYNFPDVDWDSYDWRIQDASALTNGLSQFQGMAIAHEAGRPYTVSEYNQPWPNTHGAAIDPTWASFAAFQDWDAIMHF